MNQSSSTIIHLLEVQKTSFKWFLEKGLIEVLDSFSPISKQKFMLLAKEYKLKQPKYTVDEAKRREYSYAMKLYVPARLKKSKTGEIKILKFFLGKIPLMSERGTFVINGVERVVVNQIVRSPGVYFEWKKDVKKFFCYTATLISNRGGWLKFLVDYTEIVWLSIDKTNELPAHALLNAMGIDNNEILDNLTNAEYFKNTIIEGGKYSKKEALISINKLFKPGDAVSMQRSQKLLYSRFFNPKKYDLGKVGRYKLNKKLGLNIAENITVLTPEDILAIIDALIDIRFNRSKVDDIDHLANRRIRSIGELLQNQIWLALNRLERITRAKMKKKKKKILSIISKINKIKKQQLLYLKLKKIKKILSIISKNNKTKNQQKPKKLKKEANKILSMISKKNKTKTQRKPKKLKNLKTQKIDQINKTDNVGTKPLTFLNRYIHPKPIVNAIKDFFCLNQLSQFMNQTNPLAELAHKRRLTVLGPGGLSRDRTNFLVRDIHPSYYGRICPIETPEGKNAGLVGSLAAYARINSLGFIETPFYKVKKGFVINRNIPIYLKADEEEQFKIAPGDIFLDKKGKIFGEIIPARYNQEFITTTANNIDYIAISPIQIFSIATALIPFLEHDDGNRALMGSNMQRQALPLIFPERPLVGTGLESKVARDSCMVVINKVAGQVSFVSSEKICIKNSFENEIIYELKKYQRSNQETCINQRPIVWVGEKVIPGQVIADGPATEGGELALGQNLLAAYMPWEGYNFEDAIVISERLIYDDVCTSVHIEKFEIETRETKLGSEKITREIPNESEYTLRNLDEKGIICIGAWVEPGDILVGKLTPKDEFENVPIQKLIKAIFGLKLSNVRDTSLRMPKGEKGRVVDIQVFNKKQNLDSQSIPISNTSTVVCVYVAQKRKIRIGDKLSGRHGNKGIVSKILPRQDMPYLPDGTPIDIILNPLGVPSRMNVGQVFECLLAWAGENLGLRFRLVPFDEKYGLEASKSLVYERLIQAKVFSNKNWLFNNHHRGKTILFDGRTGECFDYPVTVGKAYILKLVHLVDDKMHARSIGPYSLVTQQPLKGKAQQGGQRLGEMEVWALEAFGAAYTLEELLTIKSDDIQGRNEALNCIVKGQAIPRAGIPESFKVLIRELQALCLDIGVYKTEKEENEDEKIIDKEVDLMNNPNSMDTTTSATNNNNNNHLHNSNTVELYPPLRPNYEII
uniref:DNA-directed RNA polymerase subunit beta n=1 Tax=Cyanoptyche gloeocystis TaxID=77922 RepID=A0A3G1IWA2_9EUKA|nr:RNA polymerase beta subunit [Cyanoptyche gloeocystis]